MKKFAKTATTTKKAAAETAKKAAGKKVAKKPPGKSPMSTSHKNALAQGRVEGRIIRTYLEVLEANRPKRGRKRTTESITKRLAVIAHEMKTADAIVRLRLTQERMDLSKELSSKLSKVDLDKLESQFVKVASAYSQRNGITFTAWRELGVQAPVLKRAGILATD